MSAEWTNRELSVLKAMRAEGKLAREIEPFLPRRSLKSIVNMMRRHKMGRLPTRYAKPVKMPPPEPHPSELLRVATITAIARYANDNAIDIDTAAYRLLSKPNFSVDKPAVPFLSYRFASV